jgi:hypothetical protein
MRLRRAGFAATPTQRPNVEPLPCELLASVGHVAVRRVDHAHRRPHESRRLHDPVARAPGKVAGQVTISRLARSPEQAARLGLDASELKWFQPVELFAILDKSQLEYITTSTSCPRRAPPTLSAWRRAHVLAIASLASIRSRQDVYSTPKSNTACRLFGASVPRRSCTASWHANRLRRFAGDFGLEVASVERALRYEWSLTRAA